MCKFHGCNNRFYKKDVSRLSERFFRPELDKRWFFIFCISCDGPSHYFCCSRGICRDHMQLLAYDWQLRNRAIIAIFEISNP